MHLSKLIRKILGLENDYILVIGGAHIDVMADYDRFEGQRTDKVGNIAYAIGGTAFNIAVNLGQQGIPVALITVLKEDSFSSVWIEERLAAATVNQQFIEYSDRVPESGFIAIRRTGDLETAVTSTGIASHPINSKRLYEAIAGARFVIADCNLSTNQLAMVSDACKKNSKPLSVAVSSDSKVTRVSSLTATAHLVFLNEAELDALLKVPGGLTAYPANWICGVLHTSIAVVTRGDRGYSILTSANGVTHFPAPQAEKIESTSGCGDALAAGILKYWYEHQRLDFQEAAYDVASIVVAVLGQKGATVGALASSGDFARLAKMATKRQSLWRRMLSQEVGVAVGIVSAIAAIVQLRSCPGEQAEDNLRHSQPSQITRDAP